MEHISTNLILIGVAEFIGYWILVFFPLIKRKAEESKRKRQVRIYLKEAVQKEKEIVELEKRAREITARLEELDIFCTNQMKNDKSIIEEIHEIMRLRRERQKLASELMSLYLS
jgi:uncharacterized membrane protein YhiD involved in acid resistance